ncbi:hypothetical protein NDU88_004152 [Pleurodeles waltl]|uniref:Uncharacterized protein n=1 Tax=Pleurodeles waltl TaxID=8319 RepID=A0AAV7MAV0_PLEWA|nr:hypothetical protein NDU88_004152 [Pleurodeles waltl]
MAGQGRAATPSSSGTPLVLLSCSGTPVLLWCSFWLYLVPRPRRSPHCNSEPAPPEALMRKQAAALVTPACLRKLLPPCQQLLPRTVHLGAAAAHRSSSLGFPASRDCSPADTDFSAAVLLLARAAASSGSPQTVCRTPDAAHLALALAVSKPRREPPGTSVVRLSSSLISRLSQEGFQALNLFPFRN